MTIRRALDITIVIHLYLEVIKFVEVDCVNYCRLHPTSEVVRNHVEFGVLCCSIALQKSPNMGRHRKKSRRQRSPTSSESSYTSGDSVHDRKQPKQVKRSRKSVSYTPPRMLVNTQPLLETNLKTSSIIPDFDPKTIDVNEWVEIIQYNANIYQWSDNVTIFQALSKLRGTSKMWYDTFIESELGWSQYSWAKWKEILKSTFKSNRNAYKLLMNIVNHKPTKGCSLYDFFFEHLSEINKLKVNFSDADKISLICGAINDSTITSAIEASNMVDLNALGSYLKNKTYNLPGVPQHNAPTIKPPFQGTIHHRVSKNIPQASTSYARPPTSQFVIPDKDKICMACGRLGHDRSSCRHKHQVCNFCQIKGHIEINCQKKQNGYVNKSDNKINVPKSSKFQNVNCIKNVNLQSKFYKDIVISGNKCSAFVDFGSECSIIKQSVANKFNFKIHDIGEPVTLSGFLGTGTTVTQYVSEQIKIDEVDSVIQFYVMNNLDFKFDILIGSNFTENPDIVYYKIDNLLHFKKKQHFQNINHGQDMTTNDLNSLYELLQSFESCMIESKSTIGKAHNVSLSIELTTNKPICRRPYRATEKDKLIFRELVQELLDANIIRESKSAYSSPALLVDKKGNEKRMVVDYRALNKISVKNSFPTPIIEEIIDTLSDFKYFSCLDLASGFHQIPMEEKSIPYTAFVTPEGHYEYIRVPFGLCNAPSVFQQFMNIIFSPLRHYNVIPYLDDLLIPSTTIPEGITILNKVLNIIKEYGLTIKLKKSSFMMTKIIYLGYEISFNKICPSDIKTQSVLKFPYPKNQHQLRQFLGLIGYFRKFIKDFARKSAPLTKLLKKDAKWVWTDDHSAIVDFLKEQICSKPALKIFNPKLETRIYTDASREGYAGILTQCENNLESPVAFFSKQTTDPEKNYHSFELELLAIVKTLDRFRFYLSGHDFTIYTDCNAVKNAWNKQTIIPRIARWILFLQDFSFQIVHRPGSQMQHVDALSRNFETQNFSRTEQIMVITENDYFREAQSLDSNITDIKEILLSGDNDNNRAIFNDYDLRGNKVFRRTSFGNKLLVPKMCRWQVVKANHDDIGHFAFDKTIERIKRTFWFPKMNRFVKKYINSCLFCLYHKERGGKKPGLLHSIPKYARPHHTIHLDHLGPFIETLNGNKYLLVIVDGFSKFTYIKPVPDTSSKNVIIKLQEIFTILGNPRRIVTDAGTGFTSKEFKEYIHNKGIRLFTTATGMPRGNGQVERTNRTILDALATSGARTDKNNWDSVIHQIQQGINSTKHRVTQHTPAELLFGFQLRTDSDIQMSEEETIDVTKIRKEAAKNLEQNRVKQDLAFNKKRGPPKYFSVGDLVVTRTNSFPANQESKKLLPKFRGPFKVIEVLPNDRYRVKEDLHTERSSRPYEGIVAAEDIKLFQIQGK